MKKGILLPIFSLPSKYGIGDFGYEAYKFIDILSDNKIDYWEILPINSCNNSPYSPISFYALNENFISLDILKDMNLIKSDIDIYSFSDRIDYANISKDKYYIEDLGDITDETIKLKNKYNFKGMKILQYTLDLDNMIDNYSFVNNVVYTGNHDNNTIVGWYNNLTVLNKSKLKIFLVNNGIDINIEINKAIIKYLLNTSSKNDIVIIPVQDILGLDENNRINLPGVINNKNWSWKMKNFDDFRKCISIFN